MAEQEELQEGGRAAHPPLFLKSHFNKDLSPVGVKDTDFVFQHLFSLMNDLSAKHFCTRHVRKRKRLQTQASFILQANFQ